MATPGYDRGLDATHPMDGAISDAYFPLMKGEERKLVIESVPFSLDMAIPIAFNLDQQETIQLKIAEEINKQYSKVYLLDRQTEIRQEIKAVINNLQSTATVTLPAGEYSDRFFIVFSNEDEDDDTPSISRELTTPNVDFVQNNPRKQLEVKNPERYDVLEVSMFDMSGKLVLISYNLGNQDHFYLPTDQFSDGVYLVRLTTADHGTVNYKMTVVNK